MAQLRHIKKRIIIIKNIQKTTKAMKMIAASKLRRAQSNLFNFREFVNQHEKVLNNTINFLDNHDQLIKPRKIINQILLIGITADRGLCGSFNNNIISHIEKFCAKNNKISLILLGKKGSDYFKKRNYEITLQDKIDGFIKTQKINQLYETILNFFIKNQESEVHVIYTEFKSMLKQKIIVKKILPLELKNIELNIKNLPPIFEPDIKTVTEKIAIETFQSNIKLAIFESIMSEYVARMNSMELATKNASDVISKLTLEYNRARQASITKEMIEITVGKEALG